MYASAAATPSAKAEMSATAGTAAAPATTATTTQRQTVIAETMRSRVGLPMTGSTAVFAFRLSNASMRASCPARSSSSHRRPASTMSSKVAGSKLLRFASRSKARCSSFLGEWNKTGVGVG
jgi:hypothetical protein